MLSCSRCLDGRSCVLHINDFWSFMLQARLESNRIERDGIARLCSSRSFQRGPVLFSYMLLGHVRPVGLINARTVLFGLEEPRSILVSITLTKSGHTWLGSNFYRFFWSWCRDTLIVFVPWTGLKSHLSGSHPLDFVCASFIHAPFCRRFLCNWTCSIFDFKTQMSQWITNLYCSAFMVTLPLLLFHWILKLLVIHTKLLKYLNNWILKLLVIRLHISFCPHTVSSLHTYPWSIRFDWSVKLQAESWGIFAKVRAQNTEYILYIYNHLYKG